MRRKPQGGLARRLLPAVAIAGASGGLLIALDHPAHSGAIVIAGSTPQGAASDTTAAAGTAPQGPPSNQTPSPTAGPRQTAPAQVPTASTKPAQSSGACSGTQKTGPEVNTRFGPVMVQATISADHRICAVDAIESPNDRRRSIQINNIAVPMLDQRALSAQNARFQMVSGATITSNAYQASLQAILDGG